MADCTITSLKSIGNSFSIVFSFHLLETSLRHLMFFLFFKVTKDHKAIWFIIGFSILTIINFIIDDYIPAKAVALKIFFAVTTFYEYSLFAFFIRENIVNKRVRTIILLVSIAFVIFLVVYFINAKLKKVDSIPIGVESILLLIFSCYFFYEQLNNPELVFIYNDYKFWFITGIMIYISGSFFIYIFANQIPANQLNLYWSFTLIFMGIMNMLFSIGLLILGFKPTQKHHAKSTQQNHHYLDIT